MRYEIFKDNIKLSKLGLGAMRLPQTEPGFAGPIDEPKAQEVINSRSNQLLYGTWRKLLRYGLHLSRRQIRSGFRTGAF